MSYSSGVMGPFNQTLFLGASITKFSANAGWNSQSNDLTVELVEDPRSSTKLYYNSYCNPDIHTGPDRFNPPPLGSPVYFKFGSFSFGGILQNWTERYSTEGKIYTVKVGGPQDILDGTTVILDDYTGSVFGIPNMLNVFGYLEDFGSSRTSTRRLGLDSDVYTVLGYVPASGFGGASKNTVGIPWYEIRESLAYIINAMSIATMSKSEWIGIDNSKWLKYGTKLNLVGHDYLFDVLALPVLDFSFRFSEEYITLLALVQKVCEYTSNDFILDLQFAIPTNGSAASDYRPVSTTDNNPYLQGTTEWANWFAGHISKIGILKFVRTIPVSRLKQLNAASRIDESQGSPIGLRLDRWGTVTSAVSTQNLPVNTNNRGLEFRSEITNCFVIGENRHDIWQVFHGSGTNIPTGVISFTDKTIGGIRSPIYGDCWQDTIWNYWGKDDNNYPIYSSGLGMLHEVTLDLTQKFDLAMDRKIEQFLGKSRRYTLGAMEILALLSGDKDNWQNYVLNRPQYGTKYPYQFDLHNGGVVNGVKFDGLSTGMNATLDYYNSGGGNLKKMWLSQGSSKAYNAHLTNKEAAYNAGLIHAENPQGSENIDYGDILYEYLKKIVDVYYGRQFLVKLPADACGIYVKDEPLSIKTNYEVVNGGWTDALSIIGLSASGDDIQLFRNTDDGRLSCFTHVSAQSGCLDVSRFGKDDYILSSGNEDGYIKARVEDIVFMDVSGLTDPRAVVTIDNPIFPFDIFTSAFSGVLAPAYPTRPSGISDGRWKALQKLPPVLILKPIPPPVPPATVQATITYKRNWYDTFAVAGGNLFNGNPGSDLAKYPFSPIPITPDAIALPLKNNRVCYGPWYAQKQSDWGPNGKTEYVRDTNLAPWNFGSTTLMNIAGNIEATSKVVQQNVNEVASVTIPGSPIVKLGDVLISKGPQVTSIDVSFDTGGVTTSYQMRTFTPDYGAFSKSKVDEISRVGRNTSKLQRLVAQAKHEEFANRKAVPFAGSSAFTKAERYNRSSSHNFMLASHQIMYLPSGEIIESGVKINNDGDYIAWDDYNTESGLYVSDCTLSTIVNTDLRKALSEMRADNNYLYLTRAGCEPIGLFRPFSTMSGEMSFMPTMGVHTIEEGSGCGILPDGYYTDSMIVGRIGLPPLHSGFTPPICATTLNPFLASGVTRRGVILATGDNLGHDIDYVIRDSGFPEDLSILSKNEYSKEDWYRSIGLRAPIIVVGWGYDVDGKPVPNARVDQSGNAMTNYFEKDWLRKPDQWKAGPLDIRWDNDRGVWTSPQTQNMIRFYAVENYNGYAGRYSFKARIDNVPSGYLYYEGSGTLGSPHIYVYNPWNRAVISGMAGWAYYNPNLTHTSDGTYLSRYERYELVNVDQGIATVQTIGGGSGVLYSITMNPYSVSNIYRWNPVKILNAPDISGYNISAQLMSVINNISPDTSGDLVFIPLDYPMPIEGAVMQSVTTALFSRTNEIKTVRNSLAALSGIGVNVQWNGNEWVTINAQGFNTPVLNLT